MRTTLDAKAPTIVIVGSWNDSIIMRPEWLGKHILDLAPGTSFDVGMLMSESPSEGRKTIIFLDHFGVYCSRQRLELFLVEGGSFESLQDSAIKFVRTLPHTPVGGMGVNFSFAASEIDEILSSFETTESLDDIGKVLTLDRTEQFELTGEYSLPEYGPHLRISRQHNFEDAVFNFNYHFGIKEISNVDDILNSKSIDHWKRHADSILDKVYGTKQDGINYFNKGGEEQ